MNLLRSNRSRPSRLPATVLMLRRRSRSRRSTPNAPSDSAQYRQAQPSHHRQPRCPDDHHCGSNFSDESMSRFTGITIADLARDGAHLTATLAAEAGTFTCTGTVHDDELSGDSVFTPDAAFVDRMGKLGFTGFDSQKAPGLHIHRRHTATSRVRFNRRTFSGITIDNLIALRIFNVDPAYAQSFVSMGYEQPDADKLIALKCSGRQRRRSDVRFVISAIKPTLDELIQIRIFKITPDFIHRMKDRGLKDLTIAKLVQIRIFKLDE